MFRKPFLLESGSISIKRYLSSTPVACANNLQREPIWIDNVETFPGATLSLVDRIDAPRLNVRSYGVLVEVLNSDSNMAYSACGLARPQDEKACPKEYLVIPLPFVHGTIECALVEIS